MSVFEQPGGKPIHVQEVAPRDGFQNEQAFVATEDKIAFIDQLSGLGFAKIEVTSFTSPKAIPALRDAEEVMQRIMRRPGVIYTALVPNMRGAQRALACGLDEVNLVMSASESHNQANLRMTREQSKAQLAEVITMLRGTGVAVNVSLSTVFGCPFEGDVAADEVYALMDFFAGHGVHGMSLCDTTGMAYPTQVAGVSQAAKTRFPALELTLHFHNTRDLALPNTLAALEAGIDRFDASLAGLGGCPYAPGASGNVCTEDLVHMLNLMGYDTGIDLDALLGVARSVPALVGREVPSAMLKAGPRLQGAKKGSAPQCA